MATKTQGSKVALNGTLEGCHVLVDFEEVDMGLLEDFQTSQHNVGLILDGLARVIVGGKLPHGTDRAGIRRLQPRQVGELIQRIFAETAELPNPA